MQQPGAKHETRLQNINELTNRAAMALPDDYLDLNPLVPRTAMEKWRTKSAADLLDGFRVTHTTLEERTTLGCLLGLLGDPRINTFDPTMVTIDSTTAKLGLPKSELVDTVAQYCYLGVKREWIEKECPAYQVDLGSYRIGRYPVTHQEYRDFLRAVPTAGIPSAWQFGRYPEHLANHPVYTVSPAAADAYAAWLSKETGRQFRLPREAEWEFAAGGKQRLDFPWGNTFESCLANTAESRLCCSTPIGCYPQGASPFGLLDMAGNVEEYVADNYEPYPGGRFIGDDLTKGGTYRIARGGSFTRFKDLARCKRRHGYYRKEIYIMGFRLAETVRN